ncbi:MAG: hypothetical protein GY744_07795 [Gammaproteobacteria bacterium]|nr:hypothetical protein [Gammaproteobacteria bacterium]
MSDKHEEAIRYLYRQSRTEQPSVFVDKRIRKAASRALYKNRKQWVWSLSTAAVLVLSFTVVLNLVDVEPDFSPVTEQEELTQQVLKKPNYFPVLKNPPPAVTMEQQSLQEFAKEEVERSQRSKRKLQPSSARQKRIDETPSFDVFESSAIMVEHSLSVKTTIPKLPLQLEQLLALDKSLRGEQQQSGLIKLYQRNRLILTLLPGESEFTFMAWPGAELLGVDVDWHVSALELDACSELKTEMICSLTDQLKAVFISDKLDHVTWSVNRE